MSKRFVLATVCLVLAGMAIGCGGGKVFVREGAEPIDLTKEKILVLPSVAYGFKSYGADELKMTAALVAGTISAFGKSGFSLEPLKPVFQAAGLGGMARRLAYGVYHCIDFHKSYNLAKDSCGKGIEKEPKAVAELVALVAEKAKIDFNPRYIYALYLWAYGSGTIPGTAKCRIIACIYDKEKDLVHSCCYYTKTISKDLILAEAAKIPGDAFSKLMEAAAKPKEGEAK